MALALATTMVSSTALAAGGRVAVLAFSGTGAEVAERAIVNALPPMARTRHRAEAETFLQACTQA